MYYVSYILLFNKGISSFHGIVFIQIDKISDLE